MDAGAIWSRNNDLSGFDGPALDDREVGITPVELA